ncbi:urea transport system permease protein [Acinetobacter lwoffii]|uniref:Urea transport system permease protein n=1 Tax=Acinetobacter lwoffii TaxID=28090 RepID=A0AAW8LHW2_ACILW|nr:MULTISPECIES: urea ABC transporter permease subunit UrtB [Acinetobacter]ENU63849.1 urea ABC transporter, permease UrtB [Acinetobacter lwoffii NIPH 715]MCO8085650.1 urea ABC transporter permease subunit UrtB [Acinetobacter lwoffii]MDR6629633.1 urea transport system permease protein [Acinetobacter lwoffii]QGR75001.1 urea ABC transporter permease subunit UrtB [Acinetobacter lwoffii]QKT98722.1 urea ABC transporter permease subunit UrtB [Acinetobacter lwoffii]
MNIRVNIAAIFLVFVQVICVQLVSAEQSSNSTALTAAIQQDAIQQFVQGDFAQRRALLKQWPGSIEQLDQLAEYVENEQLYSGANGQTYILESDEKLLSYPSLGIVADWPSDLSQVTLVNTLRKALNFGLAQRKLKSEDASERLEAIDIYESNLAELNVAHINALYLNEQNNKVKARLAQLKARLDYQDANVLVKIQAAKALQDSNRPDVLAMIDNELTQPNIHSELKAALLEAKSSIKTRIQASEWTGHLFSGLSTASILLLAALGLAITYGLLGVINMAHGELIMIGAYTTYVVQSLFKSYLGSYVEWYLIAAIPAAFLVSGLIGMLIERTVIRPLYGRQLETLLATFGVSLILMQLVRMTFGAQNVEVSNISWLSGGISITPSLMLPYNRIAIIVFTIAVLLLLVYLLNKTRFGLFVRAVTQNRQMARAVGIRSSRIDMMAFGLGSGLAGLAGCALAQVGNVGPDLGQNYIIDAFLVVVVGGVGQVWGAVLAALGLGISGTALEIGIGAVLAKIVLLVLVILFIQKRPQGLFAIKGRFVE